jgi:tetratricopeptide (TPR) repeat protein
MNDDPFDEIMSLVSQVKADLIQEIGWEDVATRERLKAARWQLSAAIGAAQQGDYRQALRLLNALQKMLRECNLAANDWAEIYLAMSICYARLGEKRAMKRTWKQAHELEPDNDKLKDMASRLGLIEPI